MARPGLSALPSVRARALAFVAVLAGGACGALIGYAFATLQCRGDCTTIGGIGLITGAVAAAGGVAVVAVLTLRAMAEWRRIEEDDLLARNTNTNPQPGPDAGS